VAPPDDHAVTTWTFTQKVAGGTGMGAVLTPLQLERAHGSGPALATGNVLCGPQ
jgi:hypothetical protein